jgi:VanZ family protein
MFGPWATSMCSSVDYWLRRAPLSAEQPVVRLALPVLTIVLAATAVPIELRYPDAAQLRFSAYRSDVLLNILGYLPVGLVLATWGPARVAVTAAVFAMSAEAGQLFMMHRDPSLVDVVCNVLGGILGAVVVPRFRRICPALTLDRRTAAAAGALATVLVLWARAQSPLPLNDRGSTAPGTLEGHWKFDEREGPLALDSSGHGFDGRFSNEPKRVPGMLGNAVNLEGASDYAHVRLESPDVVEIR